MKAFEHLVDKLRDDGHHVKESGTGRAVAQCPAHEDRSPSLALTATETKVLAFCHAGCETEDVLSALGLVTRDLFNEPRTRYDYADPSGTVLRSVARTYDSAGVKKTFRPAGGDVKAAILYRLPQVVEAVQAGTTVYLVEGEEDVHALEAVGLVATTGPQGANSVGKVDFTPLKDAVVVAVVDKDDAGKRWANAVEEKVGKIAKSLSFVEAKTGKDAADHIAADHGVEDFVELEVEETVAEREPLPRVWKATDLAGVQQPSWLARQRLPRSAVTILVGDEGIGKSLLWVWVVAAVTTGRELPEFGIPVRRPEVVYIVVTEDEWSYTVRPRLEVAGADLSMIRVLCAEKDGSGSPIFPRDMPLIIGSDPAPGLVIVDAFLDTVSGNLSMKDPQQARQALHPWKEAATITGASIMLLTHTNRVNSKSARDRYGITGELRKKARMTLYAQQDEEGALVVGPEKSNIVGRVAASRFMIEAISHFPPTLDHDGTVPLLRHVGDSDMSAGEHIEATYDAEHGTGQEDRDEAVEWLVDYLASNGGEASAGETLKAATREMGIAKTTLTRARKKAGVSSVKSGMAGGWVWQLPPEEFTEESTKGPKNPRSTDVVPSVPSVVPSEDQVIPSAVPDVDDRPKCPTCGKALMAKAEHIVGKCLWCQRIANYEAPEKSA